MHVHRSTLMVAGFAAFALLATAGCKQAEPEPSFMTVEEPPPAPGNERAFARYMLEHLGDTVASVTCHCCDKPLAQCYREMLDQVPGACPPG
jgi:hypothetical protein